MYDKIPIRVVLADDHPVLREGVRMLIGTADDISVIGEADSGPDAVGRVRELHPDILVTDLIMPGLHGLEVIKAVKREIPPPRVIVLTAHAEEPLVREAFFNGASGFLPKNGSGTELIETIRSVADGRICLSPTIAEECGLSVLDVDRRGSDILDTLTRRERIVMSLTSAGIQTPEIADRLTLSPRTVETHRRNLMQKLGCKSQTELVRMAVRKGLLKP